MQKWIKQTEKLANTHTDKQTDAAENIHLASLHYAGGQLDTGGSVRTMFVDFRKAFDHVDYNLLIISKLLMAQHTA